MKIPELLINKTHYSIRSLTYPGLSEALTYVKVPLFIQPAAYDGEDLAEGVVSLRVGEPCGHLVLPFDKLKR